MTVYEAELVVDRRESAADGVLALTLRHPLGEELPAWEPGAHIDVLLGPDLERQYSLCGDPADRHAWRIGVLREPEGRGGSAYVHGELGQGAKVRVRGPRNNFALESAPRYRFIAGGIGITPILPMLAAAEAAGAEWTLVYGGRTRESMAFTEELGAYGDKVAVAPQDETGLLDLGSVLDDLPEGTLVYCCGPGPLLDAVEERCPGGRLRVERFQPKEQETGPDSAFEVVLERAGHTLTVPEGVSVLDTVRAAGVEVLFSCTEGTCGTCETDVLEGEPDHRDSVLTDEERASCETMMICVSRCRGKRLVLDL
ncbi:PDR/VanB family oxidoreductase [Streptomyces sp. NL15-2K]|uniref:PDR/VanB family oxidoreductase n=1 Tax=Streptomyces sp. NL15-2K TaxID=376149 RepID=UPI0000E2800E|nr:MULTISPECIES: PDR/VanB family oxidoreductase [Actinomycetes]WKX14586.1 PDR/VanB family oxidoreductase [Kutzneria buriramensis]BAF33364.1 reductase-subunit oxygenase [Streptomyces sp. NL15-2K]GCB44277.1 flavodoxin reductases (ferredoxin-NADPH reductases) family 1 [Streptomyces sp. NL15-2K]